MDCFPGLFAIKEIDPHFRLKPAALEQSEQRVCSGVRASGRTLPPSSTLTTASTELATSASADSRAGRMTQWVLHGHGRGGPSVSPGLPEE
jgi:hypothetical protein